MQSRIIAAIGLASTFVLGLGLSAQAQGQNPPGINPEHYECYRVVGKVPAIAVSLKDQFGATRAALVTPLYLCNPVQKNEQAVKDEKTHLVCYQIKGPKPVNKAVRVVNQFGTQPLKVAVAQLLCVPSLKELAE
jgi:hypothetical protein